MIVHKQGCKKKNGAGKRNSKKVGCWKINQGDITRITICGWHVANSEIGGITLAEHANISNQTQKNKHAH